MTDETLGALVARVQKQHEPGSDDILCGCMPRRSCNSVRMADALAPLLGPDGTLPDVAGMQACLAAHNAALSSAPDVLREHVQDVRSRAEGAPFPHRVADAIEALVAEVARLREDMARLDWLDGQRWEAITDGDREAGHAPDYCQWDVQGQCWAVRDAIDAARAKEAPDA